MKEQLETIREALALGIKAINHLGGAREAMPLHDAMPALTQLEAMAGSQEPVAWQILNGVCHAGIRSSEALAKEAASGMQKTHDLGGSLAAFHVRPLYAAPVAQQPQAECAMCGGMGHIDGIGNKCGLCDGTGRQQQAEAVPQPIAIFDVGKQSLQLMFKTYDESQRYRVAVEELKGANHA